MAPILYWWSAGNDIVRKITGSEHGNSKEKESRAANVIANKWDA
jgi:hypothetical protein